MRLLLDECLPKRLKSRLARAGKSNGELLTLAGGHFDVFITIDAGLQYQQNLSAVTLSIVLLRAPSNKLEDLDPLLPVLLDRIRTIAPGELVYIGHPPQA
jgi:hypothetical protein